MRWCFSKPLIFALFAAVWLACPLFAGDNPYGDRETKAPSGLSAEAQKAQMLSPVPGDVPSTFSGTVKTGGAPLNIRSGPWGDILTTVANGSSLKIVGQVGDWYKVEIDGKTAYAHAAYVLAPGEKEKPFPTKGWVNAAVGVNVRRVPGGDVIGKMKDQTSVEILGVSGDYYKVRFGENEAFILRKYLDANQVAKPGKDEVTPMSFTGYVTADIGLNVREEPWGPITTSLPCGSALQITGKIGDWYRISFSGKVRYVHANYISKNRGDSGPQISQPGTTDPGTSAPSGSMQQRIAQEAHKVVGSTRFRGPEVDGGNLACAQVVSTVLKNAGAMSSVVLNVKGVISTLHGRGWKEVVVPPFKEGDVITWKTYDSDGDGVRNPDSHIGIIVKQGNSFMAMNNNSRLRTPRYDDPYSKAEISRVLRKES